MASIQVLKRFAIDTAKERGHTLDTFRTLRTDHARSECVYCPADVDVKTRPAPNETFISGPAMGRNCLLRQVERGVYY